MAFWSGDTLEAKLGAERIVCPFNEKQVDCAAYTLRMGREAYVTPDRRPGKIEWFVKDVLGSKKIQKLLEFEHVTIPAGQFAWLLTEEYLKIPHNIVAFISLKTKIKFKGLINVSGFHVDPGFEGRLIYAVYNAGPQEIRIAQGDDLFLIWFAELDVENPKHYRKKDKQERIESGILVSGEIVSLQELRREIDGLSKRVTRYAAIAVGFVTVIPIALTIIAIPSVWDWIKVHF